MGLEELTTIKYLILGNGQIANYKIDFCIFIGADIQITKLCKIEDGSKLFTQ